MSPQRFSPAHTRPGCPCIAIRSSPTRSLSWPSGRRFRRRCGRPWRRCWPGRTDSRKGFLPQTGDEGPGVITRYSHRPSAVPSQEHHPRMKPSTSTSSRRRVSAEGALALWREYKATGDLQVRNRLVMTYAPLVKYIVFKKVRELPARCEVEDFISCGLEALIASIDRYDPEKGATLEQFAWTRIHGAVLDELRRQDWAPRSLRRWERDIARVREQFTGIHGRRPSHEELAASLAITVDELRTKQHEITTSEVTSLNSLVLGEEETAVERIDTLVSDDTRVEPETAATTTAAKERF